MRMLPGFAVMIVASSASAAPKTMVGDVAYDFVDQNGFGWATVAGRVTVTLDLQAKAPALRISGKRRWIDSHVSGTSAPSKTASKWEGEVDETYPLRDITRARNTITFELDQVHDKITATCTPIKLPNVGRKTLYECSFTGFQWRTIASLPELHHSIVLDANIKARIRILNSLSGKAKPKFGRRAVTELPPAKQR